MSKYVKVPSTERCAACSFLDEENGYCNKWNLFISQMEYPCDDYYRLEQAQ